MDNINNQSITLKDVEFFEDVYNLLVTLNARTPSKETKILEEKASDKLLEAMLAYNEICEKIVRESTLPPEIIAFYNACDNLRKAENKVQEAIIMYESIPSDMILEKQNAKKYIDKAKEKAYIAMEEQHNANVECHGFYDF